MLKLLAIFLLFSSLVHAEDEYIIGEGYQLGDMPIYVGGYFSLDYRKKDEQDRYRVDDLAFISYGGNDTISYFAELEFKESYVRTEENGVSDTSRDNHLYVERLYLDYRINDNYKLRFGKYNSPIGFWNLMPINVLRETTSSPILTEIIYPKYTSGLGLEYKSFGNGDIQVDLIGQALKGVENDDYNNYDVKFHYGVGLSYEKNKYTLKVNAGYFHLDDYSIYGNDYDYLMLSARYDDENYQFLTEIGTQNAEGKDRNNAAYLQGLYRFTEKHIGVVRLESYKDEVSNINDEIAIFGYTYRPLYPIAIKTEYQQHSLNNENQILFSFSVLF